MLTSEKNYCPYCGELIEIVIDTSVEHQEYIEDCSVCCRPIVIGVTIDTDGEAYISMRTEND